MIFSCLMRLCMTPEDMAEGYTINRKTAVVDGVASVESYD